MKGSPLRQRQLARVLPLRRGQHEPSGEGSPACADDAHPKRSAEHDLARARAERSSEALAETRTFRAPPELLAAAGKPQEPVMHHERHGPQAPVVTGASEIHGLRSSSAPADDVEPLAIGCVVAGKYWVVSHLDSGGSATVSLAVFRSAAGVRKLVVLKYPRRALGRPHLTRQEFISEARLAAAMNHQNVIQVYDIVEHRGLPVIVMEHLEGVPLARVLLANVDASGFALSLRLGVLTKLLAGLQHAHGVCDLAGRPLHVVHRDISPHNVVLTSNGQVKLIDFGIALWGAEGRAGAAKRVAGKLVYMAPEQLHGLADRRADVFAAGVLLWELITLRRFWGKAPSSTVIERLARRDVPQLSTLDADMDDELAAICRRALAPDVDDRYATAGRMQSDLEALMQRRSLFISEAALGRVVQGHLAEARVSRRHELRRTLGEIERALESAPPRSEPLASRQRRTPWPRRDWERAASVALVAALALQSGDFAEESALTRPAASLEVRVPGAGSPLPSAAAPRAVPDAAVATDEGFAAAETRRAGPPERTSEARELEARRRQDERRVARHGVAAKRAPRATSAEPRSGARPPTPSAELDVEPGVDLLQLVGALRAPEPRAR